MDSVEQLVETWRIHDRINRYMLAAVPGGALSVKPAHGKGRTVGEMFAHMHNVRLMWLKEAGPDLLDGLVKIEKEQAVDGNAIGAALEASGVAIAALLDRSVATGRVKGFKPHPTAFLGYLISHESHHRGEIELTLTQAGFVLDKKVSFGLWEWGVR